MAAKRILNGGEKLESACSAHAPAFLFLVSMELANLTVPLVLRGAHCDTVLDHDPSVLEER